MTDPSEVVHADMVVEKVGENLWKVGVTHLRADGSSDSESKELAEELGLVELARTIEREIADESD